MPFMSLMLALSLRMSALKNAPTARIPTTAITPMLTPPELTGSLAPSPDDKGFPSSSMDSPCVDWATSPDTLLVEVTAGIWASEATELIDCSDAYTSERVVCCGGAEAKQANMTARTTATNSVLSTANR